MSAATRNNPKETRNRFRALIVSVIVPASLYCVIAAIQIETSKGRTLIAELRRVVYQHRLIPRDVLSPEENELRERYERRIRNKINQLNRAD